MELQLCVGETPTNGNDVFLTHEILGKSQYLTKKKKKLNSETRETTTFTKQQMAMHIQVGAVKLVL